MKNINLNNVNKKIISGIIAGVITVTLTGCDINHFNGYTTKIEISNEKVSLNKLLILTNDKETLFVRFDKKDDKYVTDIFTNTKYTMYDKIYFNFFAKETTVKQGMKNNVFIYDTEYKVYRMDEYINNITNNSKEYDSYNELQNLFIKLNNLNDDEVFSTNNNLVSLENVVVLTRKDKTLFVRYENKTDKYVTNIFENKKYYVDESYKNINNRLSSGSYYIDEEYYDVRSITLYPYIVENTVNGKISKDILEKSLDITNERSKVLQKSNKNN